MSTCEHWRKRKSIRLDSECGEDSDDETEWFLTRKSLAIYFGTNLLQFNNFRNGRKLPCFISSTIGGACGAQSYGDEEWQRYAAQGCACVRVRHIKLTLFAWQKLRFLETYEQARSIEAMRQGIIIIIIDRRMDRCIENVEESMHAFVIRSTTHFPLPVAHRPTHWCWMLCLFSAVYLLDCVLLVHRLPLPHPLRDLFSVSFELFMVKSDSTGVWVRDVSVRKAPTFFLYLFRLLLRS